VNMEEDPVRALVRMGVGGPVDGMRCRVSADMEPQVGTRVWNRIVYVVYSPAKDALSDAVAPILWTAAMGDRPWATDAQATSFGQLGAR